MSSDHSDRQTANPADRPARALSIPRWAVIGVAFIVLLPVLTMSAMMLMMSLVGPSMHGGMTATGPGLFPIVGVIPLVLVFAAIYGAYKRYGTGTQ